MGDKDKSEDLFREFMSRRESGEDVSPEEYLRQHPELAGDLEKLFTEFKAGKSDIASHSIGDFKIIREIGKGGMGTVYEAEQISLKRKVALKVLRSHLSFSDEAVQKFHREAEAGSRQSHPGIVSIHAVGEHKGVHYIAQEYVAGGVTLCDKIDEVAKAEKQPAGYFREVAKLIAEIADSLQHAHDSGVIHRDIKPSNILLTDNGSSKITDFGLAKIEDALALSRTGDFAGTPYYMSPEQAASRRIGIDKRTDIYSLGVTLYEMLTLKRPFEGDTSQEVLKKILLVDPKDPHKVNTKVPRDLSVICLKAIEKIPEKRYQSMREFIDDLQRYLSGSPIHAKPTGIISKGTKWVKRHYFISSLFAVACILVALSYLYIDKISESKILDVLVFFEKLKSGEIESNSPVATQKLDYWRELLLNGTTSKRILNTAIPSFYSLDVSIPSLLYLNTGKWYCNVTLRHHGGLGPSTFILTQPILIIDGKKNHLGSEVDIYARSKSTEYRLSGTGDSISILANIPPLPEGYHTLFIEAPISLYNKLLNNDSPKNNHSDTPDRDGYNNSYGSMKITELQNISRVWTNIQTVGPISFRVLDQGEFTQVEGKEAGVSIKNNLKIKDIDISRLDKINDQWWISMCVTWKFKTEWKQPAALAGVMQIELENEGMSLNIPFFTWVGEDKPGFSISDRFGSGFSGWYGGLVGGDKSYWECRIYYNGVTHMSGQIERHDQIIENIKKKNKIVKLVRLVSGKQYLETLRQACPESAPFWEGELSYRVPIHMNISK